ncbi:MAG: DUF342 domain-containing protein [bacterium]|nr:DUF342 domain-containing protein [bacterium]
MENENSNNPEVLTIEGNLDKSEGKIEKSESIIVQGNVVSGCEVRSESDITVMGVVEDAILEAGGSIEIKEKFRGSGKGRASAEKDVILNYAKSQTVHAGNDVMIKDGVVHCQIDAKNNIKIDGNKGIIGGKVSAGNIIDIKSAGTATNTQTLISVGLDIENRKNLEKFEHDIHINVENTNKIVRSYNLITKIKLLKHGFTDEQEKIHEKLVSTFETLKTERKMLDGKIDTLIKEHLNVKAQIRIEKKVYPGVKLDFGRIKMNVKKEASKVLFQLHDGTIKAMRY